MKKIPLLYCVVALLIALVAASVFSLGSGVYQFQSGNAYQVFLQFLKNSNQLQVGEKYIIWEVRSARIVMAILIGSMLAFSGTLLQGMFKNPLATGDLIGLNAGATLMAAIAIVLGNYFQEFLPEIIRNSIVSFSAFIGAMIAMILVYRIATNSGKTNVVIMLLTGVAMTAIGFSITGFLIFIAKDNQLRDLTFWNLGSLAAATWIKNGILAFVMVLSFIFLLGKGKALNAMMLGEKEAQHLGINVESAKKKIMFLVALMTSVCVAFSGTIGFVGIIVPYILRFLFRSDYQYILPLSAISGSILLLLADTFSRTLMPPAELPIGIITALMGGPVFIAILMQYKKSLR